MSRYIIFFAIISMAFSAQAKKVKPAAAYLTVGGKVVKLDNYRPGKKASFASTKVLEKMKKDGKLPKIMWCQGLTDGIICQGTSGRKNDQCQAYLRDDRCDEVAIVLGPEYLLIKRSGGNHPNVIGGQYRGVLLGELPSGKKDGEQTSKCTEKDLKADFIRKIYTRDGRVELSRDQFKLVPRYIDPKDDHKRIDILVTYKRMLNEENQLVYPTGVARKYCEVMLVGAEPTRKPAASSTKKDSEPKGEVANGGGKTQTDENPTGVVTGVTPPVKDSKKTPAKPVKKSEPTEESSLIDNMILSGGVYVNKECSSIDSPSDVLNFYAELGIPVYRRKSFISRLIFGARSHTYNYFNSDGEIRMRTHSPQYFLAIEGVYKGEKGEAGLRAGMMGDFGFNYYRPTAELVGRLYVYGKSVFLQATLGVSIFRYRSEFEADSTLKPTGTFTIGLGFEF